jgi:hypothetical protein
MLRYLAARVTRRPGVDDERGQVLLVAVVAVTIIFFVGVITIDVGLHLVEKRGMQRAADFASLSGSLELPGDATRAREVAMEWASRNGYTHGANGVTVEVQMLCSNRIPNPPAGICRNTSASGPGICTPEVGCDSMRVIIHKPGVRLFSDIFGAAGVQVASGAATTLSFDVELLDSLLLLDDTGSMALGCNSAQSNPGCPIKESKAAAHTFVDAVIGSSNVSKVGYAPYRGCFNPPRNHPGCIPGASVRDFTTNATLVHTAINSATAAGGSRTNICVALEKARELFAGANAQGPGAKRSIVILTDGDNNYTNFAFNAAQNSPPLACRPANPQTSDPDTTCTGSPSETRERQIDGMTKTVADQLKSTGNVEIYVVGFGVCGTDDPSQTATSSYCSGIGNAATDAVADRRVLKCMASSAAGTNDHYFEVPTAQQLPQIFQIIAWRIAGRALSE